MGDVIIIPKQLRMEWTDVLALDSDLSHVAFRVACVIGSHFNRRTGDTYISQAKIVQVMSISARAVWGAIAELEQAGYLLVERREFGTHSHAKKGGGVVAFRSAGGRGVANKYLPAFERSQVAATITGRKLATRCDHIWEERSQNSAAKVATGCDPTLSTYSPTENKNPPDARAREDGVDLFEDFVAGYGLEPWMSPTAAERAFRKLTADEQVMASVGALRYAQDCEANKRKKQNAKNWLIDRGWEGYVGNSHKLAALDKDPGIKVLEPYSPEWQAVRDAKAARGESTAWMETCAGKGDGWPIQIDRPRKATR